MTFQITDKQSATLQTDLTEAYTGTDGPATLLSSYYGFPKPHNSNSSVQIQSYGTLEQQ